jgi:conjugal transfer pilus assembly protein TraW
MKYIFGIFFILLCAQIFPLSAQDLGEKNEIYPIDFDARLRMKELVYEKLKTSEIDKYWRWYVKEAIKGIKYPLALEGFESNYKVSSQTLNLKYFIDRDYTDASGVVIIKKNTLVEPLKISRLKYGLLFIDGRDSRQVDYAMEEVRKTPLKIVLIAGSAYELRVKFREAPWMGSQNTPFYFDQRRMIVNQLDRLYGLKISTVPVKLTQVGTSLQVDWGIAQ